jgi:hypothetical protein
LPVPVMVDVEWKLTGVRESGALGAYANEALTLAGRADAGCAVSTAAETAAISEAVAAGRVHRGRAWLTLP